MSVRAVIAPDERTWLLSGRDLRAEGFLAAASPASADVLIAPARVPRALGEALRDAWAAMPSRRRLVLLDDILGVGEPTEALLREPGEDGVHREHGGHGDGHDMHSGHDHHDMMAVTGEPSADGLVMEDVEFELGPLSPPVPGGVVAGIKLDGDVVCSVELRAVLDARGALVPDPLSPAAWQAALADAADRAQRRVPDPESRRARVMTVEIERAVSHAAWIASLGELLGWPELSETAWRAAGAASALASPTADVDRAREAAAAVRDLLEGSRRLRFRLRGLAPVERRDADRMGLGGPVARAAGLPVDARAEDPLYAALGFSPVVGERGDAEARTLVRAAELVAALDLVRAAGALDRRDLRVEVPDAVEGPRGPVTVRVASAGQRAVFEARGAAAVFRMAETGVARREWSAAVAALASFDLSGWILAA